MITRTCGRYTGVGSRETPPDILTLIVRIAHRLTDLGWCLRSGGADGCDTAFFEGAKLSSIFHEVGFEVYLPWEGFNGHRHSTFTISPRLQTWSQAEKIASEIHPAWDRLTRGPRALHTRNVFQVLGHNLQQPSKALLCWAKPVGKQGYVKGGTNTAVALAMKHNVPVLNLYYDEVVERAYNLLQRAA